MIFREFLDFFLGTGDGVPGYKEISEIDDEGCEQDDSVNASQLQVKADHGDQGDACHGQDGPVPPEQRLVDGNGADDRAAAEDEAEVEDVRADDVADGDIALPLKSRDERDGEFRGGTFRPRRRSGR